MSRGSPKWINPQAPRHSSADEELFPAFDETLTTGIEDTVRTLRVMPDQDRRGIEAQRWQFKAVADLTEEVKTLRHDLANVVRALDKKASLLAQGKFEKSLGDRIEARIDKIRNIAMWAIGILFVVVGIVKVAHAHG